MSEANGATVIRLLAGLPETAQGLVVDHLREYIDDLRDELHWDAQFASTQAGLVEAAKRARQEIAAGRAQPLDPEAL